MDELAECKTCGHAFYEHINSQGCSHISMKNRVFGPSHEFCDCETFISKETT